MTALRSVDVNPASRPHPSDRCEPFLLLASLILLFKPELVAGYIGFDSAVVTPELRWITLQMMGAVFLVPALLSSSCRSFCRRAWLTTGRQRNDLYLAGNCHANGLCPG